MSVKWQHDLLIRAPQSIVWPVTEDIEQWPQWTPTMESVQRLDDRPFQAGSTARIKQPGLPAAVWRVTTLTRGEAFSWETSIRGMRMVATHVLTPVGGETKSLLRVEMTGLVARRLWPFLRATVRTGLARENAGLKAACEALAAATPTSPHGPS